ncbi:MAG: Na+/H+ antiporter NhaC family protein [Clostridiales bacterium]|nr:Na+/H+ antiporter NhaC family protein [Clostridiales bacterium]
MDFGWLSILPPLIAIVLALLTKEVISSLLIGVLSGVLIYSGGNVIDAVESMFTIMGDALGGNIFIILFLSILGALVMVIREAGGSNAYGEWASKKIKTRSGAMAATGVLGCLIFVDDYFNCLTVGSVMRPVTDKFRISREKLSYLIDATAAPICIIAPISSWAVSVGSTIEEAGMADGFGTFIRTIPYNFYAILTIIMVFFICFAKFDFGSMKKYEDKAIAEGVPEAAKEDTETSKGAKGKVYDLVVPIVSLIVITIIAMLYTGGLFTGGASNIIEAFGNTDANTSLVWGGFASLIIAFVMFVPRRILSFKEFMECITKGVASMVPAIIILTFAWTISGVCGDGFLDTGGFVAGLVEKSNIPVALLPAIIFVVAAVLAFATGTSWGTFGILIPIVLGISAKVGGISTNLQTILISATLAGAVYGDHVSPISDTTILSSTGAGCNHINHVSTQLPYATLVMICCFIAYIVAGFVQNVYISLLFAVVLLLAALYLVKFFVDKKQPKKT